MSTTVYHLYYYIVLSALPGISFRLVVTLALRRRRHRVHTHLLSHFLVGFPQICDQVQHDRDDDGVVVWRDVANEKAAELY